MMMMSSAMLAVRQSMPLDLTMMMIVRR